MKISTPMTAEAAHQITFVFIQIACLFVDSDQSGARILLGIAPGDIADHDLVAIRLQAPM